jgi:hypothetical protein
MNPQEQNKPAASDVQKNDSQKQPAAANALPGVSDKTRKDTGFIKPADKDAANKDETESSTTKTSYGTK